MGSTELLLTPAEAAALLRCSTKQLGNMVDRGQLPGCVVRLNRRRLFSREGIEAVIEAKRRESLDIDERPVRKGPKGKCAARERLH